VSAASVMVLWGMWVYYSLEHISLEHIARGCQKAAEILNVLGSESE